MEKRRSLVRDAGDWPDAWRKVWDVRLDVKGNSRINRQSLAVANGGG
jgi:hypothetical protein